MVRVQDGVKNRELILGTGMNFLPDPDGRGNLRGVRVTSWRKYLEEEA